jgi:ribA/ribD-fused uncharacterized protein
MTTRITSFRGKHQFLSNFHAVRVKYEGVEYPSVEHAYQAAKTLDKAEREYVRMSFTPGIAKRRGRLITMRPCWDEQRVPIMEILLERKFAISSDFADGLLATGDAELVEVNTWADRTQAQIESGFSPSKVRNCRTASRVASA